jgi:hypothetical protein
MRTIFGILLVFQGLFGYAQKRGNTFVEGWIADKIFETEEGVISVGISSPETTGVHRIQLNKIQFSNMKQVQSFYNFDTSFLTSMHSSAAYYDGNAFVSGLYMKTKGGEHNGIVMRFNNSLLCDTFGLFNFGYLNHSADIVVNQNKPVVLGLYQDSTNMHRINTFLLFLNQNLDSIHSTTYTCGDYGGMGGCDLLPRNFIQIEDGGYLLACQRQPGYNTSVGPIADPLLIRTDSLGNTLWQVSLANDTFSRHHLFITKTKNDNIFAIYSNLWYKPYMDPDQYTRHCTYSNRSTIQFIELDSEGEIIEQWNYQEELLPYFAGVRPYQQDHVLSHITPLQDGGVVVVGTTYEQVTGTKVGFTLKVNADKSFGWYRHFKINIGNPPPTFQETKINGVTELSSGYFALVGEYVSPVSDSFPTGTQQAFVMLVDSRGCITDSCNLLHVVKPDFRPYTTSLKVFPNPCRGELNIKSTISGLKIEKVQVFTQNGKLVTQIVCKQSSKVTLDLNSFINGPALYFLKIWRSDGLIENRKVVLSE